MLHNELCDAWLRVLQRSSALMRTGLMAPVSLDQRPVVRWPLSRAGVWIWTSWMAGKLTTSQPDHLRQRRGGWGHEGLSYSDELAAQQRGPCELDYLISVTWFIPWDAAAKRRPEFQLSADQRTAATDTENISGRSASSLCHSFINCNTCCSGEQSLWISPSYYFIFDG